MYIINATQLDRRVASQYVEMEEKKNKTVPLSISSLGVNKNFSCVYSVTPDRIDRSHFDCENPLAVGLM
jgi:hypothetical protein